MEALSNRVWTLDDYLTCIGLTPSSTKAQEILPKVGLDANRTEEVKALAGPPQVLRRQTTVEVGEVMKASSFNESAGSTWFPAASSNSTSIASLLTSATANPQPARRLVHGGQHSNLQSTFSQSFRSTETRLPAQPGARSVRLRRCNTVGASDVGCRYLSPYITETRPPFSVMAGAANEQPMMTAMQLFRQMMRQRSVDRQTSTTREELLPQPSADQPPSVGLLGNDCAAKRQAPSGANVALPNSAAHNLSPTERRLRLLTSMGKATPFPERESLLSRAQVLGMLPRESAAGGGQCRYPMNNLVYRPQLSSASRRAVFQRRERTVDFAETPTTYTDQTSVPSDDLHSGDQLLRSRPLVDAGRASIRVKPEEIPAGLCFHSDHFQGSVLVQWLCRQLVFLGDSWTYSLIDTVGHICSSLVTLGVIELLPRAAIGESHSGLTGQRRHRSFTQGQTYESRITRDSGVGISQDSGAVERFELDRYYRWAGGALCRTLHLDDLTCLTSGQAEQPARLSAYQSELATLRKDYEYELAKAVRSHEVQLFRVKNQGVMKACQLTDRIEALEKEVEKYRILAGIEHLTKQTENSRPTQDHFANQQDGQISPTQSPEPAEMETGRDQSAVHSGLTQTGLRLSSDKLDRSAPPKPPPRTRATSDTNDLRSTLLKLANGNLKLTNPAVISREGSFPMRDLLMRLHDHRSGAVATDMQNVYGGSINKKMDQSDSKPCQVEAGLDKGNPVRRSRSQVKDHLRGIDPQHPLWNVHSPMEKLSKELSRTILEQTHSLEVVQAEKEH